MKPALIFASLAIAGLPLCAEAQEPGAAKIKADAQKVVKIIIGDKAKSQIYCDIVKLSEQIEETDPKDTKQTDELYQQVEKLATKLGPEYIAFDRRAAGYGSGIRGRQGDHSTCSTSCVRSSNEQFDGECGRVAFEARIPRTRPPFC
jgi:hypothetical protein